MQSTESKHCASQSTVLSSIFSIPTWKLNQNTICHQFVVQLSRWYPTGSNLAMYINYIKWVAFETRFRILWFLLRNILSYWLVTNETNYFYCPFPSLVKRDSWLFTINITLWIYAIDLTVCFLVDLSSKYVVFFCLSW
jgi:hypothetical protein